MMSLSLCGLGCPVSWDKDRGISTSIVFTLFSDVAIMPPLSFCRHVKSLFGNLKWKHELDVIHLETLSSQGFCEPTITIVELSFKKSLTLLSAPLCSHLYLCFSLFPTSIHFPYSSICLHIFSPVPLSSLPCHSLLFFVMHTWWQSLILYSIGRKVKQQSTAWWELCVCSFINI